LSKINHYLPQNNYLSYIISYDKLTDKLFVIPNLIYLKLATSIFYDVKVIVVSVELGVKDNDMYFCSGPKLVPSTLLYISIENEEFPSDAESNVIYYCIDNIYYVETSILLSIIYVDPLTIEFYENVMLPLISCNLSSIFAILIHLR